MSNATTTIPDSPGCWANSLTATATCCSQLGGIQIPLQGSSIPGCDYNSGSSFLPDDGSGGANSTGARWASCIATHFDVTADGSKVLTTCVTTQNQTATVVSTPSSTATGTSGGLSTLRSTRLGPVVLGGMVAASGLLHILSLAL
ncbi:hypothetical protein B0H11DRAFT_2236995 [Mycena galericulata]|nr:hypothetical protein B0H11DRAFT_2236995 [Mycena galericulata]